MPRVAVVGGGLVGALVFHRLSLSGADVHLLERHRLGMGATGVSGGVVRCFDDDPETAWRNAIGWRFFRQLARQPGSGVRFQPAGFLYFPALDRAPAARHLAGELSRELPVTWLTPDLLRARFGHLLADTSPGAVWEPASGYVAPVAMVQAVVAAGRAAGGQVWEGTEVHAVERDGAQITGVRTTAGVLDADAVVLAAGARTAPLLDALGVEHDLHTRVIQVDLCAVGGVTGHPAFIDDLYDLHGRGDPASGSVYLGHPTGLRDAPCGPQPLDAAQTVRTLRAGAARFAWTSGVRPHGGVRSAECYTAGRTLPARSVPGFPALITAAGLNGAGIRLGPWVADETARVLAGVLTTTRGSVAR
ncbi:FAD-binding oxidoreductase [Micromonospora sp. KC606]|uniref:NAD(P)/FAD-dependent oxidoreductase n=1 Tax=Micromonospora sp. KC606 TaxID=2530379 RepID=UPI00104F026A|nr:FAD-binding oxidoreductase [Micromonospora sp. KC606]TDC83981.1 FAD-binding oxidoreductase [Micromonospora sp. KC606]